MVGRNRAAECFTEWQDCRDAGLSNVLWFAAAGRTDHHQVVPACGGQCHRSLGRFLSSYIAEIDVIATEAFKQVVSAARWGTQISPHSSMLSVDRTEIIKDDVDAITAVPRRLRRGSGVKIDDVFWSTFLANGNFFEASNNNCLAGASTIPSIECLTADKVAFMDQITGDGNPINIIPASTLAPRHFRPFDRKNG